MKLPAIALTAAMAFAIPAQAQTSYDWSTSQISVSYASGVGCRPLITGATGGAGVQWLRLQVSNPVDGSITANLRVTLQQGTQSLTYEGGQNLNRGSGPINTSGPVMPNNLSGSRLSVMVTYCTVYPRVNQPGTGGTM